MPQTPLIVLEEADFGYSGKAVLEQVNLSLHERDFVALLGPNGAGKTTLFRGLLGLLTPLRGRRTLESGLKHRIGYVPQRDSLDPLYPVTAQEVVRMGLIGREPWYRPVKTQHHPAVLACLAQVGMSSQSDAPFFELSGGQRQRILMARALVTAPKLLVLDEPTAGVDAAAEKQILDLLSELNSREGLTIIMVTHHLQQLKGHVRKSFWVEDGRVSARELP